jgi:acetolactate synthase-1/2/3 large subunit
LDYDHAGNLKPQYLVEEARRCFPDDTIVVSDVGQNQMWVSQYFRFNSPRSYLSSGGLGTMGYSLPAAIGAKLAAPGREVLMVAGDGGFAMNIQELATLQHYGLNIKMLVLDNGCLGMVRQWQELLCEKRYCGTMWTRGTDFAKVAAAFGIHSCTVDRWRDAAAAMQTLSSCKEPMLVHAHVDPDENVLPMIPPGKSFDQVLTKI